MAKNDYFVLAYKILQYLYKCLKSGAKPNTEYLAYETKDFPVREEYWHYLLEKLNEDGLIEGVIVTPIDRAAPIVNLTSTLRITPTGIEYLQDNRMMKKAAIFVYESNRTSINFIRSSRNGGKDPCKFIKGY